MVNESFFTLACAGLIGSIFGLLLAFFGYRLFLVLLPIWGFFFGLWLGADTMQVLFGEAFLATITSWVVGFVVGAIFAVLSYLFYIFAVAVVAGALGYFATVSIMLAIGIDPGILVWLVALLVGLAFIFVTFRFNLQKYAIIVATAFLGSSVTFSTFILLFNPLARFLENPVKIALEQSWFLLVVFALMVAAGIVVQVVQNKTYTLESYNNWETE
jgi:hypothetical protein